jgi:hypothetical protein
MISKVLAAVQEYDGVKSGRQLLKAAKKGDLNHTLIRIYMQVACLQHSARQYHHC